MIHSNRSGRSVGFWKQHKFKVAVITSILFLLGLKYYHKDKQGTWSFNYSYDPSNPTDPTGDHNNNRSRMTNESKGEKTCRTVLEKLFQRPFPKKRPLFLMNFVTNKPLEIDCCNLELQLGIEYNGKQHYEYIPYIHKSFSNFTAQQYRDIVKKERCRQNGFTLIVVPYTVPENSIENYLIDQLRREGYNF